MPLPADTRSTQTHLVAHFDLSAGQQPENIALVRDGSAYLTFSFARQIAKVTPSGRTRVLATLPAPAKADTAVLTARDGIQTPTSVAVRGDRVYVPSAAYLTGEDPNLLTTRL